METVGRLARRFGLSRSALLYYDRMGLLRPSSRSPSGYRLYDEEDVSRLEKILLYRDAGLPLKAIRRLFRSESGSLGEILEARLARIQGEIEALKSQQQLVLTLLQRRQGERSARSFDKAAWVEVLRATGLDDADMDRWHVEFERQAPEAHREFLESLGIEAEEIATIRRWSQRGATDGNDRST